MDQQSFNAKIFVQGVGGFVPNPEDGSLLVLFPDQERAHELGLQTFNGEKICRHYAMAQFDLRNLIPDAPKSWHSMDLSGYWLRISSDSKYPLRWVSDEVPQLARMDQVLPRAGIDETFARVHPKALPGPDFDPTLLKAGLFLEQGLPSAVNLWEGPFEFCSGSADSVRPIGLRGTYSNVIEFELGEVSSLVMELKPLSGGEIGRVRLRPVGNEDQLDVWIRHYCDLRPPDPFRDRPNALDPDPDFAMNYALADNLGQLIAQRDKRLPFPRVAGSWSSGIGSGGNPNRCMPAELKPTRYRSVFG